MGQYYLIVNVDKRQFLHPHKFDCGLKLLEFGCSALGPMTGLAVLLAHGNGRGGGDLRSNDPIIGSWAGDRIVVAGDYGDEGSFVSDADRAAYIEDVRQEAKDADDRRELARLEEGDLKPTLYRVASAVYEDISGKVINALCDDGYLCKDFAEEYVGGSFGPFVDTVNELEPLKQKIQAAVEKHGITKEKIEAERQRQRAALRPDMVLTAPKS